MFGITNDVHREGFHGAKYTRNLLRRFNPIDAGAVLFQCSTEMQRSNGAAGCDQIVAAIEYALVSRFRSKL